MSRSSEVIHLLEIAQKVLDTETKLRDQSASLGLCPSDWETPMMKTFREHVDHARQILQKESKS